MTTYKIHPSIGIARLGNSPDEFYLSPEKPGDLPIECDSNGVALLNADGTEKRITAFKDSSSRVKRQAARFRVFAYDDQSPQGREIKIGDAISTVNQKSGQVFEGHITDIKWTVYLANKKSVWYTFQELEGEHGYADSHPRRNADITDTDARQRLITDPGPQTVNFGGLQRAEFTKGKNKNAPQTFPPPLTPNSIDTLGEILTNQQNNMNRLIVLGGFGNSGTYKTDFGQPYTTSFVNNDGWFDDEADGPVTAVLVFNVEKIDGKDPNPNIYKLPLKPGTVEVQDPAWVLVGYPRYAPQIVDIVTMDDVVYDLAVRQFAFDLNIYRVTSTQGTTKPPTTDEELKFWRKNASWNPSYCPYFWRDIWPILSRPEFYQYVLEFDGFAGGDPHNTGARGNFDQNEISVPPYHGELPQDQERRRGMRRFLYTVMRQPGQENRFTLDYQRKDPNQRPIGMPWLCGDNPLTNTLPSKFLRLTDTMLFLLRQWAEGKFINERTEGITAPSYGPGVELDRGVLATMLGGAFCPGAESSWIIRNPAIYAKAYRLHHSHDFTPGTLSQKGTLATGLEPGDITKYSGVPWQADFNECSNQPIDVTYQGWNQTYSPVVPNFQNTFWWPAHRPMYVANFTGPSGPWTPNIPQTHLGDTQMVSEWCNLGFIVNVDSKGNFLDRNDTNGNMVQVEVSP